MILIIKHHSKKDASTPLKVVLLILCGIAFLYNPMPQSDLFRIKQYAMNFAAMSWIECIGNVITRTGGLTSTPAAIAFYKIFGDIGILGLIPAASCLICYGILFTVMIGFQKRYDLSNACVATALFLFMCADYFMPTISTIRSYISSALVAYCFYREKVLDKHGLLNIFLYLIAATMHVIGVGLVAIRLLEVVVTNIRLNIRVLFAMVVGAMGLLVFAFIFQSMLRNYLATFVSYVDGSSSDTSYSYVWEQVILALVLLLQICVLIRARRANIKSDYVLRSYYNMSLICVLGVIALSFQFSFFMRLSYFASFIEMPLLMVVNKEAPQQSLSYSLNEFVLGAVIILAVTCTRGYLCSLMF
ncbi:MAG: hypothetical protein J6P61_06690 [Erysipelotrichaceae bacterium]|nr:hypothetical protein [Erysipelotrichaceae bacterium]